ncbi:hypothetical protein DIPPA_30696 [Diplonema papillatum]|nr:hypothetical protein DIPPA_30696 [Diplonema papillatum]
MDNDPTYEPIIGGHKTFSWEREFRERGLHASANEVASQGDMYFEGPQGTPAPGSGSPRRDKLSPSPSRGRDRAAGSPPPGCSTLAAGSAGGGGSPPMMGHAGSHPPSAYYGSPPQPAYSTSPAYQGSGYPIKQQHTVISTKTYGGSPAGSPYRGDGRAGSFGRPAPASRPMSTSPPVYIIPAVTPAPHTSISPQRVVTTTTSTYHSVGGPGGRPYDGTPAYTASPPMGGVYGAGSTRAYSGSPGGGIYGGSPPLGPSYVSTSHSARQSASPAVNTHGAGGGAGDFDPGFEPILGGHKTHSWEKELRERGLHASANAIAFQGDAYFEGPQGQPAPGSGSPRRNRVSASPQRTLPPGSPPPRA